MRHIHCWFVLILLTFGHQPAWGQVPEKSMSLNLSLETGHQALQRLSVELERNQMVLQQQAQQLQAVQASVMLIPPEPVEPIGILPEPAGGVVQDSTSQTYKQAYNLVLQEKWAEAEKALAQFLQNYPESKWRDDAAFWRGYCLEKMGRPLTEVFDYYVNFVEEFPKSNWSDDARSTLIRIGQTLVAQGHREYQSQVEELKASDDEEVRLAALAALKHLGNDRALEVAISLFRSTEDVKKRVKILYALSEIRSRELVDFLKKTALTDTTPEIQRQCVWLLGGMRMAYARSALLDLLDHNLAIPAQKALIFSLALVDSAEVIDRLAQIALDQNDEVAVFAAIAISRHQDERIAKWLRTIAMEAKFTKVRRTAIMCLVNRQDSETLKLLQDVALHDPEPSLRSTALEALARMASDESYTFFRKLLQSDADLATKQAALRAMGMMKREEAREFLVDYLVKVQDEDLARDAARLVFQMKITFKPEQLKQYYFRIKNPEVRKQLALLLPVDRQNIEAYLPVIQNIIATETDADVRVALIRNLAQTRNNKVVWVLKDVAQNDPHVRVRQEAVQALGMISTPEAEKALLEVIQGRKK